MEAEQLLLLLQTASKSRVPTLRHKHTVMLALQQASDTAVRGAWSQLSRQQCEELWTMARSMNRVA